MPGSTPTARRRRRLDSWGRATPVARSALGATKTRDTRRRLLRLRSRAPPALNIAIIGAGMGGLAAAASLRKQGIAVTVYEQAKQFTRLGTGIQIGCNVMHGLRGLGLEPGLRARTFYPRSWNNRHWHTGDSL